MEILAVLGAAVIPTGNVGESIMLGISFGMSTWESCCTTLLGILIPVPFLLIVLKELVVRLCGGMRLRTGTLPKKELILLLLVSIPLVPGAVWIGSAVAAASGISLKKAFVIIFCGVMISAEAFIAMSYLRICI